MYRLKAAGNFGESSRREEEGGGVRLQNQAIRTLQSDGFG